MKIDTINLKGEKTSKKVNVYITENNIEYLQYLRGVYGMSFEKTAITVANGHIPFQFMCFKFNS